LVENRDFFIAYPLHSGLENIVIFSKISNYRKYQRYHDIFYIFDIFDIFQKMKISNKL